MREKIDFYELKRKHDKAKLSKVGDKYWIDFATTMIDCFPDLFETAKNMNKHFEAVNKAKECCIDIYNDFDEIEIDKECCSIKNAFEIGRLFVEHQSNKP